MRSGCAIVAFLSPPPMVAGLSLGTSCHVTSVFRLKPPSLRRFGVVALGLLFVAAGLNHFISLDFYLPMMPPYLPAHRELIWLSGGLEVIGGLAVLVPAWRSAAGWGMVALMVAVFPANLHMALNPADFSDVPAWFLYIRLPLQGLLIWWAFAVTRPMSRPATPQDSE